jgi:hypothetical protein
MTAGLLTWGQQGVYTARGDRAVITALSMGRYGVATPATLAPGPGTDEITITGFVAVVDCQDGTRAIISHDAPMPVNVAAALGGDQQTWLLWAHADRDAAQWTPQLVPEAPTTPGMIIGTYTVPAAAGAASDGVLDPAPASFTTLGDPGPQGPQGDQGPPGQGVVTPAAYGAVGDRVADDTAALQNAVNAAAQAGAALNLGRGQYKVSAPLTVPNGTVIRSDTPLANQAGTTGIFIDDTTTAIDMFHVTAASPWRNVTFENVMLRKQGPGHLIDVDPGGVIGNLQIRGCALNVYDPGASIINAPDTPAFIQNYIGGGTWLQCAQNATVPAVNLISGSGGINCNTFENVRIGNVNPPSHRAFFHIENTSPTSYAYNNVFRNIVGEIIDNGFAELLSCGMTIIDNVASYDTASAGYTDHWLTLGRSGGTVGPPTSWTTINNSGPVGGNTFPAGKYYINGPSGQARNTVLINATGLPGNSPSNLAVADTTIIGPGADGANKVRAPAVEVAGQPLISSGGQHLVPADMMLATWTVNPMLSTGFITLGTEWIGRVWHALVMGEGLTGNVYFAVQGNGAVNGAYFGLYDEASGALLCGTPDATADMNGVAGIRNVPLTPAVTLVPGVHYRLAMLVAGGSAMPAMMGVTPYPGGIYTSMGSPRDPFKRAIAHTTQAGVTQLPPNLWPVTGDAGGPLLTITIRKGPQ